MRNSESILIFEIKLLSFICPAQSNMYNIFDPKGYTFLSRWRLGLSHLNKHRFGHTFQDCMNPLFSCVVEVEDISHYLLHCHHFYHQWIELISNVKSVYNNFESMSDNNKKDALLWFYTVTLVLIKTNINLFQRLL